MARRTKTRRGRRTSQRGRRAGSGASQRPSAAGDSFAGVLAVTSPLWILALRPCAAELFSVGGYGPDILPLAVAVVAWTRPAVGALLFATLLGCMGDVLSGAPWGVGAGQLAVLAAVFAGLRQAVATELPGTRILLVGCFLLIERLVHALVLSVWVPGLDLSFAIPRALWLALITTAFAPLAFAVAASLQTATSTVVGGRLRL
jgi:rod shape-determining protein MreD